MIKTILTIVVGALLFSACTKESFSEIATETNCFTPTEEPVIGIYSCDQITAVDYSGILCGFMPLSTRNYWVYEDSFFSNGTFLKVQYDTLRFKTTYRSATDNIIWWEGNLDIGLPTRLYANENGILKMERTMFSACAWGTNKEFIIPTGDSSKYLASFNDIAAQGRAVKLNNIVSTPAGYFSNCILFEKNARNFRKDQVIFKPGIGVVRYTKEKSQMGQPLLKMQQISTLVQVYME